MSSAPPSRERLRSSLRALLATSDLATTTERGLRKALQQEFDTDLSQEKDFIRAEVSAYLDAGADKKSKDLDAAEAEDADVEHPPKKKRKGGGFGTCRLSQPLSDLLQEEKLARSEVVKRIWAYVKEHDLQNPKDKRKIILDDALGKIFKAPLTMFTMNKQLSKHCFQAEASSTAVKDEDQEEEEELPADRTVDSKPTYPADVPEAMKDAPASLNAPVPELADFLGLTEPQISQPEACSRFWEYAKKHNLRDPDDDAFILPDAAMQKVTGPDRIHATVPTVTKLLWQHVRS